MNDLLEELNESELITMLQHAGVGRPDRGEYSRERLAVLLDESTDTLDESRLSVWREELEAHISKYRDRLRSQLPNCTGECTKYGCPDLIVTHCWAKFSRSMI